MANVEEDLYTRVAAIFTADTGAGGLNNAASSAYIRVFRQRGDDDRDRENSNWPQAFVQILSAGAQDGFGRGAYRVAFRFYLYFDRQGQAAGVTVRNAVLDRLRTLYHRNAIGTGTTWQFSTCRVENIVTIASSDKEDRRVFECSTIATTISGL